MEGLRLVMYGGRWVERCGNKEGDLRFGGGDGWEDLWCNC